MIDWQTDDEQAWAAWEAPAAPPATMAVPPLRLLFRWLRRWGWLLAVTAVLFTVTGGAVYARMQQRLDDTVVAMEADVRRSHALAWQALTAGDADLLNLFLEGGDRRFQAAQRIFLQQQLTFDRAPLHLWLDAAAVPDAPPADTSIQFSPDLRQAAVQQTMPYVTVDANGRSHPLRLRVTHVYRQVDGVWLLRRPQGRAADAFWGAMRVRRGERLALVYPARDRLTAAPLAEELDRLLQRLCALPEVACADGMQLRVQLSTDPDSVALLLQDVRALRLAPRVDVDGRPTFDLTLPTITWIGAPLDNVGYETLVRAYGGWIVTALLNNLDAPLSHAAAMTLLEQLTLAPPPPVGYTPAALAAPPPRPLPAASLTLLCRDVAAPAQVWRYTPRTNAWTPVSDTAVAQQAIFAARAAVNDVQPPPNVDATALRDLIPAAERPSGLRPLAAIPLPESGAELMLAADDPDGQAAYLFRREADGVLAYRARLPLRSDGALTQAALDGNGRFLTLIMVRDGRSTLLLHDLETGENQMPRLSGLHNGRFGWSPDGHWFFTVADRAITLLAPAESYRTLIYHNQGGCTEAVWTIE